MKNFAGLTLKGQLTESGKLNGNVRVGYSQYHYDSAANDSDLSYSVNLSHQLTERFSQSLTLSRDVTASSTNSQMAAKNYTYGIGYNASEDLNLNFSATKSDVFASTSQVDTYAYTLGADYKYSKHLTFQASYSLNDSTASVASFDLHLERLHALGGFPLLRLASRRTVEQDRLTGRPGLPILLPCPPS